MEQAHWVPALNRWGMLNLCLRAAGVGGISATLSVAVAAPLWPMVAYAPVAFVIVIAVGSVNFLVPVKFFAKFNAQFQSSDRAFAGGAAYAFVASAPWLALAALIAISINSGPTITSAGLAECAPWCLAYQAIAAIAGGTIVSVCFAIARNMSSPSKKESSLNCPRCEYSLVGNTSMQCPECGRVFTFEELGTTESEFRRRAAVARR